MEINSKNSSDLPPPNVPDVTEPAKETKSETNSPDGMSPISESSTRSKEKMVTLGTVGHVKMVDLMGVKIVALIMDGQERLCLAQISSTLLKQYSYNEIHNRRVALGITCVQCTPVQLEILRRAGAMPVSSRRCGMITKREAERLCKSFLTDNSPPKLPDNFTFEVQHQCAWGCRGKFMPSRYNSSRAKCVQCSHCRMFFSPNKFIFHSHRFTDSTYIQPDAANFNSWRRHLHLDPDVDLQEHLVHAWEDVKAMFNGGTRKRCIASALAGHHPTSQPRKTEDTQSTFTFPNQRESTVDDQSRPQKKPTVPNVPTVPPVSFPYPYHQPTQGRMYGPPYTPNVFPSYWFPYSPFLNTFGSWPNTALLRTPVGPALDGQGPSQHSSASESGPSNYTQMSKERLQEMLASEIMTRQRLESDLMQLKSDGGK